MFQTQSQQELRKQQRAAKALQMQKDSSDWLHWAKLTGIGFASGAAGQTSIYALDTIKTNIQVSNVKISPMECFKNIYQKHGLIGFYRGVLGVSMLTSPEKALKLGVNDAMRTMFKRNNDSQNLSFSLEVISGATAGMMQLILTCPLEVCKIKMQLENKKPTQVLREIGFKGLYRGSTACLARDIPFSMIYFPAYHMSKAYFRDHSENDELSTFEMVAVGLGSGTLAATLVTPMDVVKTRIQGTDRRWEQMGVFKSFSTIYREEGFAALWKGLSTRLFTRGPQFAITVGTYEFLQKLAFGYVQSD